MSPLYSALFGLKHFVYDPMFLIALGGLIIIFLIGVFVLVPDAKAEFKRNTPIWGGFFFFGCALICIAGQVGVDEHASAVDFATKGCRILADPHFRSRLDNDGLFPMIVISRQTGAGWTENLMGTPIIHLPESEDMWLSLDEARIVSRAMLADSNPIARNNASRLIANR